MFSMELRMQESRNLLSRFVVSAHKLWLRFTTGETKVFDFTPLLKEPGFAPLANEHSFAGVYIDYGVTV